MQSILKFKPFIQKLFNTVFIHRNVSEQIRCISGYKRSKQQLDQVIDTTESDSSISDKESPLHKPDFRHHNEHYEFGQRIASSTTRPKISFSIKKKNSYLDVFKKHRFSLNLEHKVSIFIYIQHYINDIRILFCYLNSYQLQGNYCLLM